MSTVLLLGAGASAASGFALPTMRSFFDDEMTPPRVREFLESLYGTAPATEWNLEDVLTHLYLTDTRRKTWLGTPWLSRDLRYAELMNFIPTRLQIPASDSCVLHERLFEWAGKDATVLTLNYDLVADQALARTDKRAPRTARPRVEKMWHQMGFDVDPPWQEQPVGGMLPFGLGSYVKLHGSVDWLRCTDDDCENARGFRPKSPGTLSVRRCGRCGALTHPFLIPPTPSKTQHIAARIQRLWTSALDALQAATSLVIFGVSFAPSDIDLRWLVRQVRWSSNLTNVSVINPDRDARNVVRTLLHNPAMRAYDSAQDFLDDGKYEVLKL